MSSSKKPSDGSEKFGGLDEVAAPDPVPREEHQQAEKKTSASSLIPVRKSSRKPGKTSLSKKSQRNILPSGSSVTASDAPVAREVAGSSAAPHVGRPVTDSEHPRGGTGDAAADKEETVPSLDEKRKRETNSSEDNSPTPPAIPPAFHSTKDTSGLELSPLATKIYTIGYLTLFSILGVLARLGLQTLTVYPGAPVQQGLVWANFTGSFVMGFLAEDRQLFRHEWGGKPLSQVAKSSKPIPSSSSSVADPQAEKKRHGAVKKTIPLFIGLATGFCGSCTSFSSFQRDVFLVLANSAPSPETERVLARNGGYSFMAVLASLIVTPALSLAALQAGAHLALALERWTPALNFYFVRGFLDPVASVLGFAAWLGAVLMAVWPPDRPHGPAAYYHETWAHETWRGQAVFACVFAPLGTLARFYVSMWLNPALASFPVGTFAVNVGGTLVEGLFYDLQHAKIPVALGRVGGGRVGCQVLQGLQDGFCGCLTTVSTFVAELKGLRRQSGYVYGLVSLAVGVGVMVIVMGSLRWTHGFYAPQCVT